MGILREIRPHRNSAAIRSARRIAAQLESGEITSAAFVLVRRGGVVSTGWDSLGDDTHMLVSGAATLAHRITKQADESSE